VTWQDQAACQGADTDAFYPEAGGLTETAERLCESCPVMAECLDWALDHSEVWGTWGGLSERERRQLRRQRVA
jgi:WhiB family transcriptional regulator, redox-sensing transcriptional regulator